jgi:hypothetical protein
MCSPYNKLSNKTNLTHFLARYRLFKVRVKVSYFYESSEILEDFSRQNHGHGGHENGVHRGLSLKKMYAGGRLCTLQENLHFRVPVIKVRPPDGTYKMCFSTEVMLHFVHRFFPRGLREEWKLLTFRVHHPMPNTET